MEHNETGCQPPREAPKLCVNNCGFFGSAATMNLCSKCHKDMVLKQEQTIILSTGSILNIPPNITCSSNLVPPDSELYSYRISNLESCSGNRCSICRKRVGLTGFHCRCGNLFCPIHRYSDKHDCSYDYRASAQNAIAKANPVVKGNKLDKI